jgi:hypothetical protein
VVFPRAPGPKPVWKNNLSVPIHWPNAEGSALWALRDGGLRPLERSEEGCGMPFFWTMVIMMRYDFDLLRGGSVTHKALSLDPDAVG